MHRSGVFSSQTVEVSYSWLVTPFDCLNISFTEHCNQCRGVARKKLKSGKVFKHQRIFVVSKTTSNITRHFKSGAVPLSTTL